MSTKQRGLGRGLGALIDDFSASESTQTVTSLPLQKVEPNPNQPRHRFDEEELQALADSISEHGILQPLAVRKMEGGFYQIIAGERRWRAARLAGLQEVPVVVVEADDKTVMELALIENLQRQDLNPMEEAEGYRVLTEEYGLTQEEAAARVGKSRPAVANRRTAHSCTASLGSTGRSHVQAPCRRGKEARAAQAHGRGLCCGMRKGAQPQTRPQSSHRQRQTQGALRA